MNQEFMKTKPILPLVLTMSLPMMLSMLINSLYNIVDSMFVARLGEEALTAVSLVYPLQTLVTSVSVGFGVGINAAVAFYLGASQKERAQRAASLGLLLSLVHGILLSAGLMIALPGFLGLFADEEATLSWGMEYGQIVLAFSAVMTVQLAFEKIYQAVGNMLVPTICLAAGCLTNIVLDPIFIFGLGPVPRMEVRGAAVATVLGQVVSVVLYVIFYAQKTLGLRLSVKESRPEAKLCQKLYLVGVPSSLTLGLPSVLITVLNGLAGMFSPVYILILGVYFKLQSFLYLPASGIVQGMRPVLSYNYGAGQQERMKRTLKLCTFLILVIMGVGMLLFLIFPAPVMRMFTRDELTVREGAAALRIISLGFVVSGISVTAGGALEALGQGFASFLISMLRYLALIVPAAWLGSRIWGVYGIWMAFPIAECLTALAAAGIFSLCWRRKIKCD